MREYKTKSESFLSLLETEKKEVEKWKDREGRSRARAESAEATTDAVNAYIPKLNDEIKGLKKDNKNIRSYIATSLESSGTVSTVLVDTVVVTETDTVNLRTFSYRDKWSKFNGRISFDNIEFDYLVRDSITFASYTQGKTLVIEGISHNPNTSITGLRHIEIIEPKKKKISIGPTVSYGLGSDGNFTWNVGIGAQWRLFEF